MRAAAGLVAVVMAALLPACGGGGGGPSIPRTVSCDFPGSYCDTLTATLNDTQEGEVRGMCTRSGGTFALAACDPSGKLAGTCQYDHAATVALGFSYTGSLLVQWFDGLAYTPTAAQAECAAPPAGTWVP